MFSNIPQVTKNLLILNALFFLAKFVVQSSYSIDLDSLLGAHYVNSPLFQPYQVITHMFMHGSILHIFFNMFVLVMVGSHLERIWGAKRFFIFYLACGIGAFFVYNIAGAWQIHELSQQLSAAGIDISAMDIRIKEGTLPRSIFSMYPQVSGEIMRYVNMCYTPMVGASGALFGVLAAFGILFPNTLFYVYFAIPIKAKYFIGGYFLLELYYSFNQPGDAVAHLAHVGGAIVGGIIVLIRRRTDKSNFW